MAKLDKTKEFIGYLKVIFGIFIAIDISLISWVYKQNITNFSITLIGASFLILVITFAIIIVNKKILATIDSLEEM